MLQIAVEIALAEGFVSLLKIGRSEEIIVGFPCLSKAPRKNPLWKGSGLLLLLLLLLENIAIVAFKKAFSILSNENKSEFDDEEEEGDV